MRPKAVGRTRAWHYYGGDTPTYHGAILLHVYYIGCMIILKMVQHYYSGVAERIYRIVGTGPHQFLAATLNLFQSWEGRFSPPHRFGPTKIFDIPASLLLLQYHYYDGKPRNVNEASSQRQMCLCMCVAYVLEEQRPCITLGVKAFMNLHINLKQFHNIFWFLKFHRLKA